MKKLLVIALCCIAVAFTSCKKEKANERFIGNYEGEVTATASSPLGDPETMKLKATLTIVAGDTDNRIVATLGLPELADLAIPAQNLELKGTCNGDKVAFDEYTIETEDEGAPVKFTFVSDGSLQNNIFKVNGTGTAYYNSQLLSTITINGDLNKK